MIPTLSYRYLNLALFVLCLSLVALSYYFEYFLDLEPCPLCLIQRYLLIVLIPLYLINSTLQQKKWQFVLSISAMLITLLGLLTASRQVWLEYQPSSEFTSCTPGLRFMLQHFSLTESLTTLFSNAGGCGDVHWVFLGLSMAEWMVAFFMMILVSTLLLFFAHQKAKHDTPHSIYP